MLFSTSNPNNIISVSILLFKKTEWEAEWGMVSWGSCPKSWSSREPVARKETEGTNRCWNCRQETKAAQQIESQQPGGEGLQGDTWNVSRRRGMLPWAKARGPKIPCWDCFVSWVNKQIYRGRTFNELTSLMVKQIWAVRIRCLKNSREEFWHR